MGTDLVTSDSRSPADALLMGQSDSPATGTFELPHATRPAVGGESNHVDERPEVCRSTGSWARAARVVLLVLTDCVGVILAGALAYFSWTRPVHGQPISPYVDGLIILPLLVLAFSIGGLYPGFGLGAVETVRRITLRVSFLFIILASLTFALRLPHHYSRMAFVIAWVGSVVLVPTLRFMLLKKAHKWEWWCVPAVVFGFGKRARRTISALHGALSLGYRPIVVVGEPPSQDEAVIPGLRVVNSLDELLNDEIRALHVALVIDDEFSTDDETNDRLHHSFRHVIHIHGFGDLPVERVEIRNLGGMLGIEFSNQLLRWQSRAVKRAIDLVGGVVGSVLALPVIAICALVLKVIAPGPVFFAQRREGYDGKSFDVLKLRTMFVDAEARLERHLASDEIARSEWDERCKLSQDPRVIPFIGRFMRRFSLDELPQLFQVLIGQMSLVGPRPFPAYHLERFDPKFRRLRCRVRPGLTGLWQVMTRSDGTLDDQQAHDTYYIRNWSLWMDLYILARTLGVVLFGKGAY